MSQFQRMSSSRRSRISAFARASLLAVSLLLGCATAAMWLERDHYADVSISNLAAEPQWQVTCSEGQGRLLIRAHNAIPGSTLPGVRQGSVRHGIRFRFERSRTKHPWSYREFRWSPRREEGVGARSAEALGFAWRDVPTGWSLYVPCSLTTAVLWTPAAIWVIRRGRRARRRRSGRCTQCGYDLRGTPDRCPECGAVPAAAPSNDRNPAARTTVVARAPAEG